ncbi:peptidase, M28D (aminopeptidase ES-62) subfamily [Luminiphilus syltensis NOR5-1B]|uniref:Carboxypeptidase Q n=1 Tax=Luminiphilus syltensis NOR5-1B TaxID=565045 RepID=B8KTE1_9GAMM|nr:M28 family peptidase [Luminiphilus syltensis]EED36831.1 peptidase, M28D (aminopeptidase ES-62) subfamily [Luminiphilus syltensis NOR5-1B]
MAHNKTLLVALCLTATTQSFAADDKVDRLIAAMLGHTPIVEDLQELTDTVGGRPTGSPANERAVDWAVQKFKAASVSVSAESFEMPMQWQERSIIARIDGDVSFSPSVIAKPFSAGTGGKPLEGPLMDGGTGTRADFERLGKTARGAWVLIETPVLNDEVGLSGLFAEYGAAAAADELAFKTGVKGIIYMSSRPKNLLYRVPTLGAKNRMPVLTMERENAKRALRLLRGGKSLGMSVVLDIDSGYAYKARNVIAEIPGSEKPEEIVLMGAHLDSHDLGTGALDNGSNATLMIDIARQIIRLGLQPERTIRFALWNGEEQGMMGSWKYTELHESELDNHVIATSFDIGTGRITGFFTSGREELISEVDSYLEPVAGLGPFEQVNAALVGTDNFDFMIEGVPNLIAAQQDANYASNYHAASDTFDKVDLQQLKLNSAIAAALVWGFANSDFQLPRQSHDEVEALIENAGIEQNMRDFGAWEDWKNGVRGQHD